MVAGEGIKALAVAEGVMNDNAIGDNEWGYGGSWEWMLRRDGRWGEGIGSVDWCLEVAVAMA